MRLALRREGSLMKAKLEQGTSQEQLVLLKELQGPWGIPKWERKVKLGLSHGYRAEGLLGFHCDILSWERMGKPARAEKQVPSLP